MSKAFKTRLWGCDITLKQMVSKDTIEGFCTKEALAIFEGYRTIAFKNRVIKFKVNSYKFTKLNKLQSEIDRIEAVSDRELPDQEKLFQIDCLHDEILDVKQYYPDVIGYIVK